MERTKSQTGMDPSALSPIVREKKQERTKEIKIDFKKISYDRIFTNVPCKALFTRKRNFGLYNFLLSMTS